MILGFVKTCSDFVFGWDVYDLLGFIPNFALKKKKQIMDYFLSLLGLLLDKPKKFMKRPFLEDKTLAKG